MGYRKQVIFFVRGLGSSLHEYFSFGRNKNFEIFVIFEEIFIGSSWIKSGSAKFLNNDNEYISITEVSINVYLPYPLD